MDPFATLGVERRYDVDLRALEKTHRELSRALHPDKHVGAAAGKREALSRAVEVNAAWRILRDPVKRAEALFSIHGVPVGETNEPKSSPAFLIEVLEQREALDEAKQARDLARVHELAESIEARAQAVQDALAEAFSSAGADREKLGPHVGKLGELRYFRRFLEEVSAIEDDLTTEET
ncbi:Fe-S protein assembly co-chaperone HscB [Pendulispora brunnea]|uniref:Co-chaperone protein HscB homolog n=1 Tax=Pendulispora brunnea TaxID=2905690 RepID=A0ABZ2KFR6_9BACT